MTAMANRQRCYFLAGFLLVFSWSSCVPHVEIEGTPCPCPDGYTCCSTLAECIATHKACPDTYPASSEKPCARDSDCPRGELCQTWSLGANGLAGPQSCRRDCSTGFPCHGNEKCGLILHDGSSLDDKKVVQACIIPNLAQGCETPGCRDCNPSYLGKHFCQEKTIHACFQNLHPECGLLCSNTMVQGCGSAGCMDTGGQACNGEPIGDPCESFSCAVCPNPANPSEFACDGTTRIAGCLVADFPGSTCMQICKPVTFDCPGSSTCSDDGYPHCGP